MSNFIFISPNFPKSYYQFPKAWKELGGTSLCIGEDSYESLPREMQEAMDEYYQVGSMMDYDQMYRAVAWFAHKHGKIDWLESNNEFWLEQDAQLRTDFNITTGDNATSVQRFKTKSNMKEFYKRAGVPVARAHKVTDLESGLAFLKETGYPVIVKPDGGVGASATWKLSNEEEVRKFYNLHLNVPYLMEEFIPGYIVTYDGMTDQDGNVLFETSHVFPTPIMEVVNGADECSYYSVREIPEDLKTMGRAVIKEFAIKGRFFHTEYFRLTQDKPGLGKIGDLVGLEVNMRPPGGYTTDMMNFANDIDVYRIYAEMAMFNKSDYNKERPYFCVYAGKRRRFHYAHSMADIYKKYGDHICMHEEMPEIWSSAMGDESYTARFKTQEECEEFLKYVYYKQADLEKDMEEARKKDTKKEPAKKARKVKK